MVVIFLLIVSSFLFGDIIYRYECLQPRQEPQTVNQKMWRCLEHTFFAVQEYGSALLSYLYLKYSICINLKFFAEIKATAVKAMTSISSSE